MECLPTFVPGNQKSRFAYGEVFPRDSSAMLSLPLVGGIWEGGGEWPTENEISAFHC